MTAPVNAPIPGSGPDATLNLTDPTTITMIVSALGAILVKAVPAIAGLHIDNLYPSIALLAAAIIVGWGLYSKHHLAAALATVLPPTIALANEITAPGVGQVTLHPGSVAAIVDSVVPAVVAAIETPPVP